MFWKERLEWLLLALYMYIYIVLKNKNYPMYHSGIDWPGSSFAEKDMEVPVDTKLTKGQQCTLAAKKVSHLLGYTKQSITSRLRKVIILHYSALVRHPSSGLQCWVPQYKLDTNILERVHWTTTKMTLGLKHLSYEERLKVLGLLSLKKRRLRVILSIYTNTWREGVRMMESDSSQWCPVTKEEAMDTSESI